MEGGEKGTGGGVCVIGVRGTDAPENCHPPDTIISSRRLKYWGEVYGETDFPIFLNSGVSGNETQYATILIFRGIVTQIRLRRTTL